MINLTDNLYRIQWLDLVFQNRNKSYGAYQLRLHNSDSTLRALIVANSLFIGIVLGLFLFLKTSSDKTQVIPDLAPPAIVDFKIYKLKPIVPQVSRSHKSPKKKTIKYTPPIVVPAELASTEPPKNSELSTSTIGTVNLSGEIQGSNSPAISEGSSEEGNISSVDNEVYETFGIEIYPEFPGGKAAFARFLSKNLKYPETAIAGNIEGKILLSFVVEKNGELSNIKILRGIGFGCDDEAIRVLKKSPRWSAGQQNKQSVRVAYTLPINFQIPK